MTRSAEQSRRIQIVRKEMKQELSGERLSLILETLAEAEKIVKTNELSSQVLLWRCRLAKLTFAVRGLDQTNLRQIDRFYHHYGELLDKGEQIERVARSASPDNFPSRLLEEIREVIQNCDETRKNLLMLKVKSYQSGKREINPDGKFLTRLRQAAASNSTWHGLHFENQRLQELSRLISDDINPHS